MPEGITETKQPTDPHIDTRDWGECGVVLYEEGQEDAWIQYESPSGLADVEP